MQAWEYTWEIIINLLESLFGLIFIEDKLKHSNRFATKTSMLFKISYIILDSINTSIMNYLQIHYAICYIIAFFVFLIFTHIFYTEKTTLKLLFSSIYLAIIFASDIIATLTIQFFFQIETNAALAGGSLRIPATLIYISSIAILVYISHFVKWKHITFSPFEALSYIFLCIIGFFLGEYIIAISVKAYTVYRDFNFSNELLLVASFYCVLFLILLSYIYILSYTKEQNKALSIENQQLLLEEADYKNLLETTESLRRLKHDMQHHLSSIQFLVNNKNYDDLDEYLKNYIGTFDKMHKFISTGNAAIDCILSSNIPKAEQKGINVNYAVTVPDTFSLNPILTSSLLGNLWANAITACENLISSKSPVIPTIDFYIKPIENMLLISIENTFDGICKKDTDGNYLSIKADKSYGIGMKRINEIVDQNDGILEVTDSNNRFCVHIMFPLKEKSIYEDSNS